LPHVLERVAALMQQSVEAVARATTENAERLFRLS
jgi:Tat protein secretion system quality control protein TatD with DNase activity